MALNVARRISHISQNSFHRTVKKNENVKKNNNLFLFIQNVIGNVKYQISGLFYTFECTFNKNRQTKASQSTLAL